MGGIRGQFLPHQGTALPMPAAARQMLAGKQSNACDRGKNKKGNPDASMQNR